MTIDSTRSDAIKSPRFSSMNNILVLYDSATGNTARMATFVAEGAAMIAETDVRVRSLDEATAEDVLWCDGLAVGSPTNMGILSWKMKRFWDEVMGPHWMKIDGKIGCAFATAGGFGGGQELACQSILTVLMNFGILVFGVTDYVAKTTTLHYGAIAVREPRAHEEQAACRRLGQRLAEWTATMIHGRKGEHPLVQSYRSGPADS
jgi:NAD(P)H dehydrogenase (quinone)